MFTMPSQRKKWRIFGNISRVPASSLYLICCRICPASAQIAKEMAAPRNKIVFLGRIARVKGIEQLIDGFALSGLAGDFELMIAGPIQDNELYQLLLKKAQELSVAKHVSFIGPVAGVTAEFTSDSVRSKWTETYLRLHEQSLTRPNRQAQTDHPACAQ
jgi:glycosyltransferase involved in cell wall biosynthesis